MNTIEIITMGALIVCGTPIAIIMWHAAIQILRGDWS